MNEEREDEAKRRRLCRRDGAASRTKVKSHHGANGGEDQCNRRKSGEASRRSADGQSDQGTQDAQPSHSYAQMIGQILLPEICSNVCFGGGKRNRLFMTGSQSLYAAYVETQGAHIT